MTFLVPFDGSRLSTAALTRARVYAIALEEAPPAVRDELLGSGSMDVIAVSIVPESARYARRKGWIDEDEPFDARSVVEQLHQQVTEIDPGASFEFERVDGAASAGTISTRIRQRARADDVSTVFIGSENAGRIITPVTSVGAGVTADSDYDVHIVRRPLPPDVRQRLKSRFFLVD